MLAGLLVKIRMSQPQNQWTIFTVAQFSIMISCATGCLNLLLPLLLLTILFYTTVVLSQLARRLTCLTIPHQRLCWSWSLGKHKIRDLSQRQLDGLEEDSQRLSPFARRSQVSLSNQCKTSANTTTRLIISLCQCVDLPMRNGINLL